LSHLVKGSFAENRAAPLVVDVNPASSKQLQLETFFATARRGPTQTQRDAQHA
jgi:hypothetical protein